MTKPKPSKSMNKRPLKRPVKGPAAKKYVTITLNLSEDTEAFIRKVARLSDQSIDAVISVVLALDLVKKRSLKKSEKQKERAVEDSR